MANGIVNTPGVLTPELPTKTTMSSTDSFLANIGGKNAKIARAPLLLDLAKLGYAPDLFSYDGENLETKFASEINGYADVWAWLRARCAAKDLSGIFVKDYVQYTANGNVVRSQVAAKNHDLRFMDTEVTGFHLDFISKDLWPATVQWNLVNYNNGLSSETSPYMVSNVHAFINSLSASVPNATTVNPATTDVDYTAGGIYYYLPAGLKAVIVPRRVLIEFRYNASGILTDSTSWGWKTLGNLYIPSEVEVYNMPAWSTHNAAVSGTNVATVGWNVACYHQFEIFRDAKMRIKGAGHNGSRTGWWLSSVYSGASSACLVHGYGYASDLGCSNASRVPVCFRVAAA